MNLRAPGGYIPDKMDYAYNVDVYQIWAESLVYGENRSFPHPSFQSYVTHFGRGAGTEYLHSADEVRREYAGRILIDREPPKAISGGMGSQVFVLRSEDPDGIRRQADFILRHKDGSVIRI